MQISNFLHRQREKWGVGIVKVNQFFSKPIGMLLALAVLLIIIFVFFAIQVTKAQHQNNDILNDTHKITLDVKKVLCEDVKPEDCNLSQAVNDILADHNRQDARNECYVKLIIQSIKNTKPVTDVDFQNCLLVTDDKETINQPQSTSTSPPSQSPQKSISPQNQNNQNNNQQGNGNNNQNGAVENFIDGFNNFVNNIVSFIR